MRISDLVEQSGVPLATVKFYIREGMLAPGRAVGARRSEYDEEHLSRLRLIRSLTAVAGLPLARAKEVLAVIDRGDGDLYDILGQAIQALSPEGLRALEASPAAADAYPYASRALAGFGDGYAASDPRMESYRQLDESLRAAEESGLPIDDERLAHYAEHMLAIARAELADLPAQRSEAVEYSVLGTALYEPVLASLRRLAHQNLATRLPGHAER